MVVLEIGGLAFEASTKREAMDRALSHVRSLFADGCFREGSQLLLALMAMRAEQGPTVRPPAVVLEPDPIQSLEPSPFDSVPRSVEPLLRDLFKRRA